MPPMGVMVKKCSGFPRRSISGRYYTIPSVLVWWADCERNFPLKDAAVVSGEIKRLEDLGVTDLCGFVFQAEDDAFERTVDFLGSLT